MKNSFGLVLAIILFVGLGCSLLNKTAEKVETPTPSSNDTSASPKPDATKTTGAESSDLTMDKFNEIKTGMTYEEVVKILGSEGTETRSSEFGNVKSSSYKWEGDKFKRIYGTFRDNKLTTKSQSGLSASSTNKDGAADLSMDKYNQIKNGMSYEEVVKIIGSEGEETNSSTVGKYETKSFNWKGENYSRIFATFRNNELSSKSQSGLK